MNKRQKLVLKAFLNNEEEVLNRLEKTYGEALEDIEKKAEKLKEDIENLEKLSKLPINDEEKEVLLSRLRSKVYQKKYQEALKKQVNEILDKMHTEEFKTVSEYLDKCYEEGFVGTLYDLQGQGIPLVMPIDQEAMVRAVQLDSKISKGLYSRLGEDVTRLKKLIASDVSRGISTGMTFKQIAGQLKAKTNIGYNNAVRIARTEGHRIQCQSAMDACHKAKEIGADVVKQWDSTLDDRTRESHAKVDGEIRELDEKFSNGLMFPGDPSGGAAEVINCRCALLQRARKALDEDELKTLQDRAEFFGLDKTDNFEEYKRKYLNAVETPQQTSGNVDFRARRQERMAQRQQATITQPNFAEMDKKQLEMWASENLQTIFDDTNGVNTDFLRESVKVINEFEQKMGGNTIDGLYVKFGGLPSGVYAKYDDKTNTLLLKKTGSLNAFTESQQKTNARSRLKLKKDYYATESYSGTIWHELGHAVDIDTGQALSRALSASKDLDIKSVKISVYAGSTQGVRVTRRSEAWAENFAAYLNKGANAKDVPGEIIGMIEGYFEKYSKKSLTKSSNRVKINTQFFAESDIKNQTSNSLKRAMRKYKDKITLHQDKIANPQKYISNWASMDVREQNGLKKHWQKEINNFQTSIDDRIAELKARGDYDE